MLGISDVLELTGKVGDLVKAGMTLELQETIVKLREAVLDVKEDVLRLREENQALRAKAAEKSAWVEAAAQYELVATPTGGTVYHSDGPPAHYACPTCFASEKIIPLQPKGGDSVWYLCPQCKAPYPIKEHKPSEVVQHPVRRGGPYGWMRV
jgi:hypothetical protein